MAGKTSSIRGDEPERSPAAAAAPSYSVRATERTLDILDLLARAPDGLPAAAIARSVGIPRSTAFRYLTVLEARHYVSRVGAGLFSLGPAFLSFERPMLSALAATTRPLLERLRDQFGETMNLGALVGTRVLYVDVLESSRAVRLSARAGDREFVHSSALGKAIASHLPEQEVRAILAAEGLPQLTAKTITHPDLYIEGLADVRKRGYATDMGESEDGACCIGVAIDPARAPVKAALSFSCPAIRFRVQDLPPIVSALQRAAEEAAAAIARGGRSGI
jgi:IclR family acetate operon transcriptional repressor